jgi:hypothetical protein
VAGFSVSVVAVETTKGFSLGNYATEISARFEIKGEETYLCNAGISETDNNVLRLKNAFANVIPKKEETLADEVKYFSENIEQAKAQIDVPFKYKEKIAELEEELKVLDARLSGTVLDVEEDVIGDPDDKKPISETAEEKAEREKIYNTDDDDYQPVPDNDNDKIDLESPTTATVRKR